MDTFVYFHFEIKRKTPIGDGNGSGYIDMYNHIEDKKKDPDRGRKPMVQKSGPTNYILDKKKDPDRGRKLLVLSLYIFTPPEIKRKTPIGDGNSASFCLHHPYFQIKRKTPIGDGNDISTFLIR